MQHKQVDQRGAGDTKCAIFGTEQPHTMPLIVRASPAETHEVRGKLNRWNNRSDRRAALLQETRLTLPATEWRAVQRAYSVKIGAVYEYPAPASFSGRSGQAS